MTDIPLWVLSIAYWLHIMATVIWIGGMFFLSTIVLPFAKKSLDDGQRAAFLDLIQKKFQPIGWLSLGVLGATGMFQMSEHPLYEGFMSINNPWAVAIFMKHIVIVVMVGVMLFLTWGILPAIKRLALKRSLGKQYDTAEQAALIKKEQWLTWINLVLSILVLLLTAVARSIM